MAASNSIFRRLFGDATNNEQERALWARTDGNLQINDPSQLVWIGGDQWPGVLGSNTSAEALPVVTRATSLITGPLTAAPFKVQQAGAGAPMVTPRWLTDPMMLRPDGRLLDGYQAHPALYRLSRSEFWTQFIRCAIWWGEGAMVFQTDADDQPLAGTLRLINPLILGTENGRWVLGTGPDRAVFDREGRLNLGGLEYRIVVLRNPHSPIDTEGRSKGVFALSPSAFGLASQIDAYTAGTFKSGIPAGYLKVNQQATQEQIDALKATWLANHGGDTRSIAVLTSTTDFTPLSISPVDAELASVKRLAIGDVAFAFGLDPRNLNVSLANSATYSNMTEAWENHRDFGLSPWIAALQDLLSSLMPGTKTVSVSLDDFANPTEGERYKAFKTAIDAGILTINEVREMEGLPPLPAQSEPVDPPLNEDPDPEPEPTTEETA